MTLTFLQWLWVIGGAVGISVIWAFAFWVLSSRGSNVTIITKD